MKKKVIQIKVKTDPETGEYFLDINDFASFLDISKISSYELVKEKPGKEMVIKFYDQEGKVVMPK